MTQYYYDSDHIATNEKLYQKVMSGLQQGKYLDCPWMIPGGADINPALYGETVTHTHWFHEEIDKREFELVKLLLELEAPMLGICRGHQLITTAAGGTLYQDIVNDGVSWWHQHGPVDVTSDHFLVEILREEIHNGQLRANSLHHQATKDVPDGWEVGAWSEDGIIESIFHPDLPQVISVQWHPEMLGFQYDKILDYLDQFTR